MKGVNDLILELFNMTDRQIIDSLINTKDINDYGIIEKVNSDDTVDVKHAAKKVMATGKVLEPGTITPNIEVLWPSSKEFSMKFKLTKGDRVHLIGMKYSLPTVDIVDARVPLANYHYSQETLKAVPMCLHLETAKMIVEVEDGKMKLANQVNSLASVIGELLDALTTGWFSINCVVGAPVTPLPTTITAINAARTKLLTIFKD